MVFVFFSILNCRTTRRDSRGSGDAQTVAPNNLYNAALQIKGASNIKGPANVVAKPYLEYFGKSNRTPKK